MPMRIFTILSLAGLILVIVIWVWTRNHTAGVNFSMPVSPSGHLRMYGVRADPGGVRVWTHVAEGVKGQGIWQSGWSGFWTRLSAEQMSSARSAVEKDAGDRWLGFRFRSAGGAHVRPDSWANSEWVTQLTAPYWALVLLAVLAPSFTVGRAWKRRRRTTRNLCSNCGYDLRATPNRCPECGAEVNAKSRTAR